MPQIILHVSGEISIIGEVEVLPKPDDNLIIVSNPRTREGKELHYIQSDVVQVIWPIAKISFIEIISSEEDEEIIGFVRE